jgi:RhtB (resistance to homoserine/threonine) family protein
MLGIENYALFTLSCILLNMTPGSDTLYLLGRTISQGRQAGMISVLGIITGALVHTLSATFGLSLILMHSAMAFNVIKWCGAGYLIYLGIKAFRTPNANGSGLKLLNQAPLRKIYLQGVLTNVLNPKVALFYLAFLPQFVDVHNNYGALPFLLLGLTFITTGTIWCSIVVTFSALVAEKLKKNAVSRYLNKITGVIFIALGLKLLKTTRP